MALIHDKLEGSIKNITYFNDRILQTTLQLCKARITHVISVYAPDINISRRRREINFTTIHSRYWTAYLDKIKS